MSKEFFIELSALVVALLSVVILVAVCAGVAIAAVYWTIVLLT